MEVKSPITGDNNIKCIKKIKVKDIVSRYKKNFNIDVNQYFKTVNEIFIYEDQATKYRFYYPFHIDGDGAFYEQLQKFSWYYMPWKWEHEKCLNLLTNESSILEVGCASGEFLQKVVDIKKIEAVGLELNKKALKIGQEKGLDIRDQRVEVHAEEFSEHYEVVCSFQVLEHISKVKSFVEANLKCLKKGGKLVFCVPNNDSFTKYNWENDILNMPPHHMGLWTRAAFEGLGKVFDLQLKDIHYEPLQPYHIDWYINIQEKRFLKGSFIKKLYYKTGLKNLMRFLIEKFSSYLHGHTIMAVYIK